MYIESMKTQPIDYNKLYAQARKLFFDTRQSYNLLDRKTESLAYLIALETGLRVSDLLKLKYNEKKLISPRSKRYRPPKKSLAWAVLILAIMGGYKATPSALPPGQTCLWRGLDKLESAVIGFLAAQEYL